ncbi:MAG: hypothetical protein SFW63_01725 [Alphaproteobacteria bacterium]|nr:hypothetical protein [Alphaproteobacteria bacterium]
MDVLGTIKPAATTPMPVKASAVLPAASSAQSIQLPQRNLETVQYDAKVADAKRQEAVANAARNAPQPLGSQVFTMFKDSTGQIVTRFRDTNSGKVTYIPEPQLLRMAGNTSGSESLLNIKV